jgi:SRSO17 transposase
MVEEVTDSEYESLQHFISNSPWDSKGLILPSEWADDKKRCLKAGIPQEYIVFKTKQQLALEMISEHLANGVHFDYVNGDGLYGNGYEFSNGLDSMGINLCWKLILTNTSICKIR